MIQLDKKINTLFRILNVSGMLLLIVFAIGSTLAPPKPAISNPDGIYTTIIAFELAKTPLEIANIIGVGDTKIGKKIREGFRAVINLDFLLIILYSLFMYSLMSILYVRKRIVKFSYYIAVFFILLAAVSDVLENFTLIKIMDSTNYADLLSSLELFTYVKWEALSIIAIFFTTTFAAENLRLPMALFGLSFVAGIAGLFIRKIIELQTLFLGLSWAICWYKTLPTTKKPWLRD